MVLCPVVGPLFFFVVHLFYLTIFRFQVELDDVVFSKERVRTQLKADEENYQYTDQQVEDRNNRIDNHNDEEKILIPR